MDQIERLLALQDGVIARRQALAAGLTPVTLRRLLRRGDLVVVHPGVYVQHNGPLTWRQRAWAAVLFHHPAALRGWSAVRAHEGPGQRRFDEAAPIDVVVAHGRTVADIEGIRVLRSRRFDDVVQANLLPPRLRYEDAVLDLADHARDELQAIAVLADACGSRRTTAERLMRQLGSQARSRRRRWLESVLTDISEGTCSVLEHRYLTHVERAHGLPRGCRQVVGMSASGRRLYRDVTYSGRNPVWIQHVELDGRLGHDSAQDRDSDFERDLNAAVDLEQTVRLGFGQVFVRPCVTAAKLGLLLQRRGWPGAPHRCSDCAAG